MDASFSSLIICLIEKSKILAGSEELARMILQTTWVEAVYIYCSFCIMFVDIHPCSSCLDSSRLVAALMKSLRGRREFLLSELFLRPGRNDHLSSSQIRNPSLGLGISWSFRVNLISCFTHEQWGKTDMVALSCGSGLMLLTYCVSTCTILRLG